MIPEESRLVLPAANAIAGGVSSRPRRRLSIQGLAAHDRRSPVRLVVTLKESSRSARTLVHGSNARYHPLAIPLSDVSTHRRASVASTSFDEFAHLISRLLLHSAIFQSKDLGSFVVMRRYLPAPVRVPALAGADCSSERPLLGLLRRLSVSAARAARRRGDPGHPAAGAAARLQPRRQADRSVRRAAAHSARVRGDSEADGERGARRRGRRFFQHSGVDYPGLLRAIVAASAVGRERRRRQHDHDAARRAASS